MTIKYYSYLSKVFTFLQQKLVVQKGCETFGIQASKTNIMMLGMFVSSSIRAAIYYKENLETYKLMDFEQIQSLFSITKILMMENSQEIRNVKTIDSGSSCWTRPNSGTWSSETLVKAKVRAYSDSVSCLGKMSSKTESKMVKSSGRISDVLCNGRVPWNRRGCNWIRVKFFSQDSPHCGLFNRSRTTWKVSSSNRDNFLTKSFSCQCSMTQIGQKETLKKHALRIQKKSNCTHRDFRKVTGRLSGLEMKWSVIVQRTTNLGENRNFLASKMVQNYQERKHPVTTSTSALNRGILRKIKGKSSRHLVKKLQDW